VRGGVYDIEDGAEDNTLDKTITYTLSCNVSE